MSSKQLTGAVVMAGALGLLLPASFAGAAGQMGGQSGQQSGSQQSGQSQSGTQTIKGEVIVSGEILRLDADEYYMVKDQSGKEVRLFVGDSQKDFSVGDKIEAQVAKDGTVKSIKKMGQSQQSQPSR